jgi:HPt (histidine-containing phosphotransfer) domain-containing protein
MDPQTTSLDLSKLLDVCTSGGVVDQALLVQLLAMFLTDNSARLQELPKTAQAGDVTAMRRVAHAVAGSAATAGAVKLARLARGVEQLAAEGTLPPTPMIDAVTQEFAEVRAMLRSMYPDADTHA